MNTTAEMHTRVKKFVRRNSFAIAYGTLVVGAVGYVAYKTKQALNAPSTHTFFYAVMENEVAENFRPEFYQLIEKFSVPLTDVEVFS